MPRADIFSKKPFNPFCPPGRSRRKTPPAFFSQKNFQTQNPTRVASGVGLEPWRRRGAPQRRRFIFLGGCLRGAFQFAGVPGGRGPILPTDVGEDNKKISGIFPGKVISVESGKLSDGRGLGSRPVLGGLGGEIPLRYSTLMIDILEPLSRGTNARPESRSGWDNFATFHQKQVITQPLRLGRIVGDYYDGGLPLLLHF